MIFSQYSSHLVCLRNEGFLGLYIKCVLELPPLDVSCKLREGVKRKKDHEKWTVLIEQSRQNVRSSSCQKKCHMEGRQEEGKG